MSNIITNKKTRLRLKAWEAPLSGSKILGEGIDILKSPDGHLSCPMCQNYKFEVWAHLDTHRLEIGCTHCGWSTRLLLPMDIDLKVLGQGRFSCFKHKNKGMVIIKNSDKLCIGCELCKTQIVLKLSNKNLIVM